MKKAKTVVTYNHKSTSSSNNGEKEDRISELPDSLLHLIFSFLDMSYVVQTSFLSRRWRYLWTSLPFLNFDHLSYIQLQNSIARRRNSFPFGRPLNQENHSGVVDWFTFVDRVLIVRNQNFNIESFSVGGNLFEPEGFSIAPQSPSIVQIESWILTLVRQNVKEINLILIFGNNYLPRILKFVSHCKSLTMLKLGPGLGLGSGRINSYLPHDDDDSVKIHLPSLKTLHLSSVGFWRGMTYNNFFSRSCPVLETLVISTCFTCELAISLNDQLKNLVIIDKSGMDSAMVCSSSYPLSVFAPKLINFCFKGGSLFKECSLKSNGEECSLKNNPSLLKAEITTNFFGSYDSYHNVDTMVNKKWKVRAGITTSVRGSIMDPKVKHIENLIKCMRQISNVRCLTLSTWLLEGVYEIYKTGFIGQLIPFCNLSVLKLRTTLSMSHCRVIANLLEECPTVQDVVLELPTNLPNSLKEDEEEGKYLLSHCNLHYLKFVQIQNSIGRTNELVFLKFLLKNAMMLEKVTVCAFKYIEECNDPWDPLKKNKYIEESNPEKLKIREKFKTFREELVNFVAASNLRTKIYFKYLI